MGGGSVGWEGHASSFLVPFDDVFTDMERAKIKENNKNALLHRKLSTSLGDILSGTNHLEEKTHLRR